LEELDIIQKTFLVFLQADHLKELLVREDNVHNFAEQLWVLEIR
jgi:hypothetical protein